MHQFALDVPKATVKEKQAMWVEVQKLFGDVKSARQDVLDMRGDCIPEKLADETIANLDEQINTLASVMETLRQELTNQAVPVTSREQLDRGGKTDVPEWQKRAADLIALDNHRPILRGKRIYAPVAPRDAAEYQHLRPSLE